MSTEAVRHRSTEGVAHAADPAGFDFFNQIGQGVLLLTIHPADRRGEKKPTELIS